MFAQIKFVSYGPTRYLRPILPGSATTCCFK